MQEISLHLCVYIFKKKYRSSESKHSDPSIPLVLPPSEHQEHVYKGTSTKKSNIPSKITASVKRRSRGYARQGKDRRRCFNLEHLIFAPHSSRAVESTPPFSSHLQEGWDGFPESPPRVRQ